MRLFKAIESRNGNGLLELDIQHVKMDEAAFAGLAQLLSTVKQLRRLTLITEGTNPLEV